MARGADAVGTVDQERIIAAVEQRWRDQAVHHMLTHVTARIVVWEGRMTFTRYSRLKDVLIP